MTVYGQCKLLYPQAEVIFADDLEGRGKGWAMREGLKQANRGIVCFIDGDMDICPSQIYKLLEVIPYYDVVIGKRNYQASWQRKIVSWGYKVLISTLFGVNVDTQTGLKVFRREVLDMWRTDSFAYDIEILAKAKMWGYKIGEVDIDCKIVGSKTKWRFVRAVWDTFKETLRIWKDVQL